MGLIGTSRRWFAILAVLALFVTACSGGGDDTDSADSDSSDDGGSADSSSDSGDDGDSGSSSDSGDSDDSGDSGDGGGDSTADAAPARGITDDTITIGYAYLDFEPLIAFGLATAGYGDQELAFQTLVDDLNASGGIHGRQLEVIYKAYSPLGAQDAEAACLLFTEDNEVFAVLGGFLGPAEPVNTCIAGRGETVLVGGVQSEERLAETSSPWITDRPPRSRLAGILLSLLELEGLIEGRQVAMVTNIDAQDSRDQVLAEFSAVGVNLVEDLLAEAPIGDVVAEDTVWSTLVERIRTSGADTVLLAGNPGAGIRNLGNQGVDVDIWVIDQESLANLGASIDLELARGAIAAAPLTGDRLWEQDDAAACRETFSAANPDVEILAAADRADDDENWGSGLLLACRFLQLFQVVAEAAGPELNQATFAEAAAGLTQFSLAAQPFASLGPDKFDSNDSYSLVEFNPDGGASGSLDPITDVYDVTP